MFVKNDKPFRVSTVKNGRQVNMCNLKSIEIMKTIKYLVMGALLAGFSTTANAQVEELNAALQAIKSNAANKAELVKTAQKKNKKNAEALVQMGRTFYEQNDTAEARRFAMLADAASKHKSAPAFILLGDIEALANDGGKAAGFYNQATYCDPKDPTGYYKYALVYRKISPRGAVQKLQDLRAQRPDVEVDALSGHIYYLSNEFEKARDAYGKVPVARMEKNDIVEYAMASYFLGKHAEGLERIKAGLSKDPRNAAMNRLAMFFNTELGNYGEAVQYGDALFNKSDSAKFSYMDYTYLGNAFSGLKEADKAIEQYKLALNSEFDNKSKRAGVVKQLSDAYAEKEDYLSAITHYKEYLEGIEQASANDIAALGSLYMQHANKLTDPAAKKEAFLQADGVYADLSTKFENAVEYANFMRARVNSQMDLDSKQGLAKPYYDKLIELISPKAEKDATDKARLIEAYRYNIAYYFIVKEDKATAKTLANQLIALDPDNEIAKQVLGVK